MKLDDALKPCNPSHRTTKPASDCMLTAPPDRSFINETLTVLEDLSINIETRTSELSTRQLALDQREAHLALAEPALEARLEQLDHREAQLARSELAILADLEQAAEAVENAQNRPCSGSTPVSPSSHTADVVEKKLASLEQAIDSTSRDNRRLTLSVRDLIASNKQLRQQLAAQNDTIRTQAQHLDAAKRDLRQTRAQLKLAKSVSSAAGKRGDVGTAERDEGGLADQAIRLRAQLASATTQATQMQLAMHELESDVRQARSQLASTRAEHDRKLQEQQQLIQLLVNVMSGADPLPPYSACSHMLSPPILSAIARALALSHTPVTDSTWRSALTRALTPSAQPASDNPSPLSPTAQLALSTALLTHLPSPNTHGAQESIDTLLLLCTDLGPTSALDHTSLTLLVHTLARLLVPFPDCTSPIREKAACALISLLAALADPLSPHLPPDFDAIASLVIADLVDHGILYQVSPGSGSKAAVPGLVPVLDAEYSLMPAHACLAVLLKAADEEGEGAGWVAGMARVGEQVREVAGLIDEVVGMGDGDEEQRRQVGGLREMVGRVWDMIERERARGFGVGV